MLHLAYLGADVGERREIYRQNLSQGLVLIYSQDCPNLLKWRTPLHIQGGGGSPPCALYVITVTVIKVGSTVKMDF